MRTTVLKGRKPTHSCWPVGCARNLLARWQDILQRHLERRAVRRVHLALYFVCALRVETALGSLRDPSVCRRRPSSVAVGYLLLHWQLTEILVRDAGVEAIADLVAGGASETMRAQSCGECLLAQKGCECSAH